MKCLLKKEDWNKAGIYRIVNMVNGKCYVGSTSKLRQRYKHHVRDLTREDRHSNPYLQNAYNKHGADSFTFELLEIVDIGYFIFNDDKIKRITSLEDKWIKKFRCLNKKFGYNIRKKAESNMGIKYPEEHRKKLRGRVHTEEEKIKRALAISGDKHPSRRFSSKDALFVKERFEESGLTKTAFAKKHGFTTDFVRHITNGKGWRTVTKIKPKKFEKFYGEKIASSIYTEKDALFVAQNYKGDITKRAFAEKYGYHKSFVCGVLQGKTWSDVTGIKYKRVRPNPTTLTKEQAIRVRELFETGKYTHNELAKKFNCTRYIIGATLRKEIKQFDDIFKGKKPIKRWYTEEDAMFVAKNYTPGEWKTVYANRIGYDYHFVCRVLSGKRFSRITGIFIRTPKQ